MASLAELTAAVERSTSAVVAFSGGVDSSLVAAVAAKTLGERALAVTAVSPAVASGELEGARAVARAVGIAHETVTTDELARAAARGFSTLLSGANLDDLGEWRPGLRAAARFGVRHPLVETSFRKADVRACARELEVPSADKPATPCLASRVPFGTRIDVDVLRRIDRAETAVKALGFRELRVRHLGDRARVEIAAEELPRALGPHAEAVRRAVLDAGYVLVEISREPFRSGSLTRTLLPIVQC